MNPQVEAVKMAVALLRQAFPDGPVMLNVIDGFVSFSNHAPKTYAQATEWMRSVGCNTRTKQPMETWTVLQGTSEGINWATYPDELPPTCRKVIKTERIPQTQVVQTGEFIEVTREVVECGPDPDEIEAANQPQPELATV